MAHTYSKIQKFALAFLWLLMCNNSISAQHIPSKIDTSFIAKNLEFKGIALQDDAYTIWGCAPIQSEDGKTHLFAARWPEKQ